MSWRAEGKSTKRRKGTNEHKLEEIGKQSLSSVLEGTPYSLSTEDTDGCNTGAVTRQPTAVNHQRARWETTKKWGMENRKTTSVEPEDWGIHQAPR